MSSKLSLKGLLESLPFGSMNINVIPELVNPNQIAHIEQVILQQGAQRVDLTADEQGCIIIIDVNCTCSKVLRSTPNVALGLSLKQADAWYVVLNPSFPGLTGFRFFIDAGANDTGYTTLVHF